MKKLLITLMIVFFVLAGCGTDGKDGDNGSDGIDGIDGTNGEDGTDGAGGTNGKDGANGVDGEDGKEGKDGVDGQDGQDGEDGKDGASGADGTDGTNGADGADGTDGEDGEDGKIPFGFDLIKPENNKSFATTSFVTYTLAKDVQNITFIRTRISGTGPETDSVVLTGDYALAGYHEFVEITGAELTEGDTYNLTIEALDMEGDIVELTPVFNLTVDNTGPKLLKADAYQSVFGLWNAGDRLVFTFNEPMDISNISTLNDIRENFPDCNGTTAGDDFAGNLLVWSSDLKILSLTCSGESENGIAFTADSEESSNCSEFNPASNIRDYAGNRDATTTDIKLISKGDVSMPRIYITSPADGSSIPIEPTIFYELTEDLIEGKLIVTYLEKGTSDEIVEREWSLDPARLAKGARSISFSWHNIPALVDGAYYSIVIEGKDGAGNKTSDKIYGVVADDTAPTSPDPATIFIRNYSGELVIKAGETVGESGDYLRLYIDGVLTATAKFPGPYGKSEGHVVITGLGTINEGSTIEYSLIDKAENESEIVSDGTMPAKPSSNDISKLGVRADTTDYAVGSTGNIAANTNLYINLNMNAENTIYAGWTDGAGNFTPSSNTIPSELISHETEVFYVYLTLINGHFSDYSEKDGEFVRAESISVIDNDISLNVSPDDWIVVTTTGGVYIPFQFGNFSYGSATATAGGYQWSAALNDFNVAPVSIGSSNFFNGTSFYSLASGESDFNLFQFSAGDNEFTIGMSFAGFTDGDIEQIRLEVHPLGSNNVLSYNGGHCLLPSTQIAPDGTTGGLISPDF